MLNHGQHPLTPLNIVINNCHVSAAKDLVQSMFSIMQNAKKHLLALQNRQKSYADTKRREISFDVETQMLLSTSNIKPKMLGARKLLPRWIGHFKVLKKVSKVTYILELSFDIERILIHEVRDSCTRPHKFYLIKWLGYGLKHNSWELEKKLSLEVLKEYGDTMKRSHERLAQNKDVESVSVSNKINKKNNYKRKRADGLGV